MFSKLKEFKIRYLVRLVIFLGAMAGIFISTESRSAIQISVVPPSAISGAYWSFTTSSGADFSLSAVSPVYTYSTNEPKSTKTLITAAAQSGFKEDITLAVAEGGDGGLGSCAGWTFDPNPFNPQGGSAESSLWIKTDNCPKGTYSITVKGTSSSIPDPGRTTTFQLGITSPPSGFSATKTTRPPFWRSILP